MVKKSTNIKCTTKGCKKNISVEITKDNSMNIFSFKCNSCDYEYNRFFCEYKKGMKIEDSIKKMIPRVKESMKMKHLIKKSTKYKCITEGCQGNLNIETDIEYYEEYSHIILYIMCRVCNSRYSKCMVKVDNSESIEEETLFSIGEDFIKHNLYKL